jgi:nucleoside-diphosphate-sugar epimerase
LKIAAGASVIFASSLPAFPQAGKLTLVVRGGASERIRTAEGSMRQSTGKARAQLGYAPRYEPEDAALESVRWLIDHGQLEVASPLKV